MSRQLMLLLALVAYLFQIAAMGRALGLCDESIQLVGAMRVLHGELPYRDFWELYTPAQLYILALLFKLFGPSVLVERLYDVLCSTGIVCMVFLLVDRLATRVCALGAYAIVLLWVTAPPDLSYGFPTYPALLFALLSLYFFTPVLRDEHKPALLIASGVCAGLAALFRQDFGAYICISEVGMLLWLVLRPPDSAARARAARSAMHYAMGLVPPVVIVFGALLVRVPVHDLFFDLIQVPATVQVKFRWLPFPDLHGIVHLTLVGNWPPLEKYIVFLPAGVIIVALSALLRRGRREIFIADWSIRLFALMTAVTALLFIKGSVRPSAAQMIQSIVLSMGVLAILISKWKQLGRLSRSATTALVILLAFSSFGPLHRVVQNTRGNLALAGQVMFPRAQAAATHQYDNPCRPADGLDRIRCFELPADELAAIHYIQQHTKDSEGIFVGAGRHDKLFVTDLAFYFASKRLPVLKWYDFIPGIETTLPIQREMVADLTRAAPNYIVTDSFSDGAQEPNLSQYSSGVTVLDRYIRTTYGPVEMWGTLTVWRRSGQALISSPERLH